MGGKYYGGSSCSVRETVRDPLREAKKSLDNFFSSHDRKHLLDAYKQCLLTDNTKGFIDLVFKNRGIGSATNEFPQIEIESKLEIAYSRAGNVVEARPVAYDALLDLLEFAPAPGARFLKDPMNAVSTGKNHFFGTDDGHEKITLIEKGGNWYLKQKGDTQPYEFGIPGEQFVLRRSETRAKTDPLEVALTIFEHQKGLEGELKYRGFIEKTKAESFLLQVNSGRIYSMVITDSARDKDNSRQYQLELEYAGHIPGFKTNVSEEREVVDDIVAIMKHICFMYQKVDVNGEWEISFLPTTERKYDFVSDSKSNGQKSMRNGSLDDFVSPLSGVKTVRALPATRKAPAPRALKTR